MHEDDSSGIVSAESIKAAKPKRALLVGVAIAVVAGVAAYDGISDRAKSRQELNAWTAEQAIPAVNLVKPIQGATEEDLVLPGTIAAYNTGTIYARASGYVTNWTEDIGAHVKKGQVLATIDAPDLDQQLAQARADLASAKANLQLADVTLDRWQKLATQNIVSQQDKDEKSGDQLAKTAAVKAAEANVARLEALSEFKNLKAPFDGVVTSRSVDIGDLLNAGGTTGHALFKVSDLHKVRIYVNVPQASLGDMTPGLKATLKLPGRKDTFEATLVTTSNALTENNRSALVELQADNPKDLLWPGAYAEVHFHIPGDPNLVRIPATALIFGSDGLHVASVSHGKVAMEPVEIGRNLGTDVEIVSGLTAGHAIIDSPQESLVEGEKVHVTAQPMTGAGHLPKLAEAQGQGQGRGEAKDKEK